MNWAGSFRRITGVFRNISVRTKVIGSFACTLVATIALGLFATARLATVNDHAQMLREKTLPAANILGELNYWTSKTRMRQADYVMLNTTDEHRAMEAQSIQTIEDKAQKYIDAMEKLVGNGPEREISKKWIDEWHQYVTLQSQLYDTFKTQGQAAAVTFYNGNYRVLFSDFRNDLDADVDFNAEHGAAEVNAGRAAYESARIWIFIALGLSAALCLGAGVTLVYTVSRPLHALTEAVTHMTSGDMSVVIPETDRSDEVGKLAGAMDAFKLSFVERAEKEHHALEVERAKAEETAAVVESIGAGLEALAEGDLTYQMTAELTGAFAKLKDDFNTSVARLRDTMKNVMAGSTGIRTGASEISDAADDLSRRTEQQAASLEQTAAALDEITSTVDKTAQNAREAIAIVGTAESAAEEGGRVVETAIKAMGQIEQSSKQITDIIGVIDEIAFQTNLLALNAGVEAARAGDAGKGFAVVASEVRALAQRSSEAAKEIKTLIKASGEHVGSASNSSANPARR